MSIITGAYSVCSLGCRTGEDCDNSCLPGNITPDDPAPADMRKPEDGGLGEPDDWGADGAKWAAAFQETAIRLGYSDMDEGWLIGWFANAIERGRVAHPDTKRERATLAERDRRIAELEAGLKPFADEAEGYDPDEGDGRDVAWNSDFTIASLRRARALLSGQQDTGGAHG